MEAARAFVAQHTSRTGHKTNVEELVNPAVTWEQVKPHRHEIRTEAIDKEVHRHHYHTTVQPLSHREVLPEKHTHNLLPFKHTTHQHDDVEATKQRLATEAARFKDSSTTAETTHSHAHMPAVIGVHHHHHIHETVIPVIYKETHRPEIVHTTIPVHEHHHMKAKHHTMSALPMKTMEEFKAMKTRPRTMINYDGPPREYQSGLHTSMEKLHMGIKDAFSPSSRNNKNLTLDTAGHHELRNDRRLSSDSGSSMSSLEQPMTPRSPGKQSKTIHNLNNTPSKDMAADRPLHIVDNDSPRMAHAY